MLYPRSDLLYILDDGWIAVPCPDIIKWAMWMETANRTVAATTISWDGLPDNDIKVVTHFIGLDHSFGNLDKPMLYETLVLNGNLAGHTDRAADSYLALRRHYMTVETVITIERGYHRRKARQLEEELARLKSIDEQTGSNFSGIACPKCGGTWAHKITCEDEIQFA